jgi:glycogen synthase
LKIAIFASAFYPHSGGVEELVRQLAMALLRRGDEVIVLTNRWPRDLPLYERVDGVEVFRFAMREPGGSLKSKLSYTATGGAIRRSIHRLLIQREIDVLHVQCVSCNASYARAAKRALGLPLVVTTQGEYSMDATGLYQRSAEARARFAASIHEADTVTGCSRQTLDEAVAAVGGRVGGSTQVIYNGVRLADFDDVTAHGHGRPYMFAIGRHVPQKGFDVLLRAYAELVRAGEDAGTDLLLAGDGADTASLRALAEELAVATKVMFLGRVDRKQAASLFMGCAFFVLPSRHEPFGIVNLEAMASGKAVVATRVGGVPEFVQDGETGLLVPAEDAKALRAAMARLLGDQALRDLLGEAGRRVAEGFDWSKIAQEYRAVYERVIAGRQAVSETA